MQVLHACDRSLVASKSSIPNSYFMLLWMVTSESFASNFSPLENSADYSSPPCNRFWQCTTFLISGSRWTLLDLGHVKQAGSTYVDLALRFEVLALCAVFAFVGAILLGAF